MTRSYSALHVLKGRLLHELRAMLASARDARKSDPTVPAPRATIFTKSTAKKPDAKKLSEKKSA